MKRFLKVITLLILLLTFTACSSKDVARVNGETITEKEFNELFALHKKLYDSQYGPEFLKQETGPGRTMETEVKNQVLNLLIEEELIKEDLSSRDIVLDDEYFDEKFDEFIEGMGGEESFNEFLEQIEFTNEDFNKYTISELYRERHFEMFVEENPIDEDIIAQEYDRNKNAYDVVTASHILVETKEEAEDIMEKLEYSEFSDLAKEYSQDSSGENGGELGAFYYEQMVPPFSEKAFSLEIDETGLAESEFGWHIILVTDREEGLELASDRVEMDLQNSEYMNYVFELENNSDIEILVEFAEEVNLDEDENIEENSEEEVEQEE